MYKRQYTNQEQGVPTHQEQDMTYSDRFWWQQTLRNALRCISIYRSPCRKRCEWNQITIR